MLKRAVIVAGLMLCAVVSALGGTSHGVSTASTGIRSEIVGFEANDIPLVNLIKGGPAGNIPGAGNQNNPWPQYFNSDGYPINQTTPFQFGYGLAFPGIYLGTYTYAENGTITRQFNGQSGTIYSVTGGATVAGCASFPCQVSTSPTISFNGTSGQSVVFDFSTAITNVTSNGGLIHITAPNSLANGGSVTIQGVVCSLGDGCGANGQFTGVVANRTSSAFDLSGSSFPGGDSYTSGGQLFPFTTQSSFFSFFFIPSGTVVVNDSNARICKTADYTADNTCNTTAGHAAQPGGFNYDFVSWLATLGVGEIRFLNASTQVFGVGPDYAHSWQTTAFNYFESVISPSVWFGSTSGTNAYTVSCANGASCNYTLTGGAPADGDMIQFFNVNANTNMTPTLAITDANSVTSAAIPILQAGANSIFVRFTGSPTAGDTITATFTTTPLGAYTCFAGGAYTTATYTVGGGTFTANSSGSTSLTISGITGSIGFFDTITGTGWPAGTTITSQISGTPGGNGVYKTSTVTTLTNASLTDTTPSSIGALQQNVTIFWINDTTLPQLPTNVTVENPEGGSGTAVMAYASNACAMSVAANITGAASEIVTFGNNTIGALAANTVYSANYIGLLKSWWITGSGGAGASWPYIEFINLVNAVSALEGKPVACWFNINAAWSDASVTALADLLVAHPCNSGGAIPEVGNEIWNVQNITSMAEAKANSIGLSQNFVSWKMLRTAQVIKIMQAAGVNLHSVEASQAANPPSTAQMQGTTLCGNAACSNSNYAYDNAIGVNFNTAPNRPGDLLAATNGMMSQAPYYYGALVEGNGAISSNTGYHASSAYGSWSATCSVAANVLTCGTPTGSAIYANQGIAGCDGTYIAVTPGQLWSSAQLTGTVATTTTSATGFDQVFTVASVAGVSLGMWVFDATTGSINGVVSNINGTTITTSGQSGGPGPVKYAMGSGDTIVFGGLAGTYQLNSTTCSLASGTETGGDVLGLQYAADNFNGVNTPLGSTQDALNWFYQDAFTGIRSGILEQTHTVQAFNVGTYASFVNVGGFGLPVGEYEGGFQGVAPTSTQATTMGLPSSAYGNTGGYVDLLVTGFKKNSLFKKLEMTRYAQAIAGYPAGSFVSWFHQNAASWSLYQNNNQGDVYSPVWQSYNAICDYNGGSC